MKVIIDMCFILYHTLELGFLLYLLAQELS
jgi:hypothetical protein